jgi:hypothetical protein
MKPNVKMLDRSGMSDCLTKVFPKRSHNFDAITQVMLPVMLPVLCFSLCRNLYKSTFEIKTPSHQKQ